jgi:hypothetical protein
MIEDIGGGISYKSRNNFQKLGARIINKKPGAKICLSLFRTMENPPVYNGQFLSYSGKSNSIAGICESNDDRVGK